MENGVQRGSRAQSAGVAQLLGVVDDNSLKEELETCKHFLVDSQTENGRHRIYNFAMGYLDPKYLLKRLDVVFDSLKRAAELTVVFGFFQKRRRRELKVLVCPRKLYTIGEFLTCG